MSVANADEARKALKLARDYREKGSYSVALKWARKSSSLSPSSEASDLTATLEKEIAAGATSTSKDPTSSATKATGAETHPSASGTHQRPGHGSTSAGGASASTPKDSGDAKNRSFTLEQTKVVKRVIACKAHEYYSILAGELDTLTVRSLGCPLTWVSTGTCSRKELF
jgi:DnaJ family protein B protein 12